MSTLSKILVGGAMIGITIVGVKEIEHVIKENLLTSTDFENATWIEYNSDGTIWGPYMAEDIPHNKFNWPLYTDEVRSKNNGNLQGTILLPDLDSNGYVGR